MAQPTSADRFDAPAGQRAPNGWEPELLAAFRAGERQALEAIYRKFAPEVSVLLRRGFAFESRGHRRHFVGYRSAHDLHDALHETFRRAFEPKARDGYDGIRPYGPYLRTIARNLVLGEFRRRETLFVDTAPGTSESAEPLHAEPPASPESAVASAQVRKLVREFLTTLSPDERSLLQLRFVDGLSQRDAADRLSIGRQRIRGRETKLRKKLVRFLNQRGASEWMGASAGAWLAFVTTELAQVLEAGACLQRESEAWA